MSDKYSLIIMRDSSQKVSRLRISTQVIKFGLIFSLIFILLIVGGIIFSVHSIGEFASLSSENSDLRTSLAEAQMQLERLQNVETFLKDSEQVALYQTPLDTGSAGNGTSGNQTAEVINTTEVVATVFPDAVNATAEVSSETASTEEPSAATNSLSTTNATAEASSPAKVSNVEIKARSPKSVRLAFDLNNETPGVTLAGSVELFLITQKDEVHEITVPRHDMLFQINYYKRMKTAFPLPEGINLADIKSLQLKVSANGKDLQTETIPFPELEQQ